MALYGYNENGIVMANMNIWVLHRPGYTGFTVHSFKNINLPI